MKKLLFALIISFMFSGCAILNQYEQRTYIYDFRKFSDSRFIITPSTTGFTYTPVGNISITFIPGYSKEFKSPPKDKNTKVIVVGDDMYDQHKITPKQKSNEKKLNYFNPDPDFMLNELVNYAKSLGATGIMNFKADGVYHYTKNGLSTLSHYELSGFAVKIEE